MKKIRFDRARLETDRSEQLNILDNHLNNRIEEYDDLNIKVVKMRIFLAIFIGAVFAFGMTFDVGWVHFSGVLSWTTLIIIILFFWYFGTRSDEFRRSIIVNREDVEKFDHLSGMIISMDNFPERWDYDLKNIDEKNEILLKYNDDTMSHKHWEVVTKKWGAKDIYDFQKSFYVDLYLLITDLKFYKENLIELNNDPSALNFLEEYSLPKQPDKYDPTKTWDNQSNLNDETLRIAMHYIEENIKKYLIMYHQHTGSCDINDVEFVTKQA